MDKAQSTMRKSAAQERVNDPRVLASAAPKTPDAANDQSMVKSKARTPVRAPGIHTALRSQAKKASVSTEAVEAMTAADAAEAHGPQKELQRQQKTQELRLAVGKDHQKAHASMRLQKLRLEKNQVRAKLAILKDNLLEAKRAIRKVTEATSRVTKASEKFLAGPLAPQAVSINLARMRNRDQRTVMQRSEAWELSSVVQKLEADKDAEMRAREEERQRHKAVMKDMMELRTVGAQMLQDDQH